MKNKEKREYVNERLFSKGETIIEQKDIKTLRKFKSFKYIIDKLTDYDNMKLVDNGKHTSVNWVLYKDDKYETSVDHSVIKRELLEIYPKSELEKSEDIRIEKKINAKIMAKKFLVTARTQDKFKFGKYKQKKIIDIKETDPKYIEWCKTNIEGFTNYLELIENKNK